MVPEISYCIDTCYESAIKYADFFNAKIIIVDCTEMRSNDIVADVETRNIFRNLWNYKINFKSVYNEYIILTHFSYRLTKKDVIQQFNE